MRPVCGRSTRSLERTGMEDLRPPAQARHAVALLWASLVLTSADFVATIEPLEDAFDWTFFAIFGIATSVYAYVIYSVSRRQNWARLVIFVVTVVGAGATLMWPPDIGADAWWSILLMIASTIADVVAMILLFSGAGHAWFKGVKG